MAAISIEGFSKNFVSDWLCSNFNPSVEQIKNYSWGVVPVVDVMNIMEAEWLSDAIKALGIEEVVGLAFQYGEQPTPSIFEVSRDALLSYSSINSYQYVCLTSINNDFLYFKDDCNRFFLLCGKSEFLKNAYRCSFDTAEKMYFDCLSIEDSLTSKEVNFLKGVWNKYVVD